MNRNQSFRLQFSPFSIKQKQITQHIDNKSNSGNCASKTGELYAKYPTALTCKATSWQCKKLLRQGTSPLLLTQARLNTSIKALSNINAHIIHNFFTLGAPPWSPFKSSLIAESNAFAASANCPAGSTAKDDIDFGSTRSNALTKSPRVAVQ